jgi:hypothetical protein
MSELWERRRRPQPGQTVFVRMPRRMVWVLAGLITAVIALTLTVAALTFYVIQDHSYVVGRGEYRDREQARLQEQLRQSLCDLLDTLPEGGLLERPRAKYDCGPGIPLSAYPPDVRARIWGTAPTPTPSEGPP